MPVSSIVLEVNAYDKNVIIDVRFEVFTAIIAGVQLFRDVTSAIYIPEDLNFQTVDTLKDVRFLVFHGDGCRDCRLRGCDTLERFRKYAQESLKNKETKTRIPRT
jgi:hypothetical protein